LPAGQWSGPIASGLGLHLVRVTERGAAEPPKLSKVRQRVENVQLAMHELNEHFQALADQLIDQPWDPDRMTGLRERLQQQSESYVMDSQRVAHHAVTGGRSADEVPVAAAPKIELF